MIKIIRFKDQINEGDEPLSIKPGLEEREQMAGVVFGAYSKAFETQRFSGDPQEARRAAGSLGRLGLSARLSGHEGGHALEDDKVMSGKEEGWFKAMQPVGLLLLGNLFL